MQRVIHHLRFPIILVFAVLALPYDAGSQVVINEVCNANYGVTRDEYGDYRDWIELLNTDADTVSLEGYCLGDDSLHLDRWCFPEYTMGPGEHMVLFASGKDIGSPPVYWETIIRQGDEWKYILPGSNTPGDWIEADFNDSLWNEGPTGIGYSDGDDETEIPSTIAVFMRKTFPLDDPSVISGCLLHMDYDDAFVAYINGKEIARSGITGFPPTWDQTASNGHEAEMYRGAEPQKFNVAELEGLLREGNNVLAIQVHNVSPSSSDMTAIPFLSLQTSIKPDELPPEILNLSTTYFHTDFRLDADGESLYLYDPEESITDSVNIPVIGQNNSYGRLPADPGTWVMFETPTPGSPNNTPYFKGYIERVPVFSQSGGRFGGSIQLVLSSSEAGDSIYYTMDGTDPEPGSSLYETPIELSSDQVIRARIIRSGYLPGEVITRTYFTGEDHRLPVICITTDPYNFFDYNYGIYVKGPNAQNGFPYFDANFWQDWERPVHLEMYENGNIHAFSMGAGAKIYGGWTRGNAQKSLAFFARRQYGTGKLEFQLFPDRPVYDFESFVIRNSGNDWYGQDSQSGSMIRDMMMTRLTLDMDIEYMASRQAIVYINGEYWGIQNLREKISEHFIASNKGADPERIDMLEANQFIIHGDNSHYANLISFLEANSVEDDDNYEYVKRRIDIQNFINYQISQIYFDNQDWPGNNMKYWRSATPKGKWRWILYDTDFGFGLWDLHKVYNNTLEFATEPNGPDWPNPPWATFLLRQMLNNQEFREQFINSFADRINTSFSSDSVTALVNDLRNNIFEEMHNHAARWGGSRAHWYARVNEIIEFGARRPALVRSHVRNFFRLGGNQTVNVMVSDTEAGFVKLNSMFVRAFPFSGVYFPGVPVELTAIPRPGYRFTGWSGTMQSPSPNIQADPDGGLSLTANFEPDPANDEYPVIINEVCYTSDTILPGGDWVELYNNSDQYVDISGWVITDSDTQHTYRISQGTILPPKGYYVFCNEMAAFETAYPQVDNYAGELEFGLDNDEDAVRLYNISMELVDSVRYQSLYPWPVILPGMGYTMALTDPDSDNTLPESWKRSKEWLGTPGGNNQFSLGIVDLHFPADRDILFQNSPNPFARETRILFHSGSSQHVNIAVYDLNGRILEVLADAKLEQGQHEFSWMPAYHGNSIYILRVNTPESTYTLKMVRSGSLED
jgi:uncharacterized repeat protein (TIGR02543 family)